jgi:hypothetical protein
MTMSVLRKLWNATAGTVLLLISVFDAAIITMLVRSEVMPAIRAGSLNVQSSTMILNIVWDGNEIYILLAFYLLLAVLLAWGAIRLLSAIATR